MAGSSKKVARSKPAASPDAGLLYYGDNLTVLPEHIKSESVDLIYLDPPFNSSRAYNTIFKESDGSRAEAQVKAFTDTWRWEPGTAYVCESLIERGGRLGEAVKAFKSLIGHSDLLAYLVMMAPRLAELHRVLKPTGSLYLHCDPTASHYLKILLDAVFGRERFDSEIIWRRYGSHNDSKTYGAVHDTVLFFTKSNQFRFNKQYDEHSEAYVKERFKFTDPDGRRWAEQNLSSPNPRPNLTYSFTAKNGTVYEPPKNGWKCARERMQQLDDEGRLHYPSKAGGRLRLKSYLDELPGLPVQDVWIGLTAIGGTSPERIGYPTQKPLALLERIISASSNPGDVVLDPFCGCGTAIAAAQKLGRRWVGIDITHVAIGIIQQRLSEQFGLEPKRDYKVVGSPVRVPDAEKLARDNPFEFQVWAVNTLAGRPVESKKGADQGIDGKLFFHDEPEGGPTKTVVISVKSGATGPNHVRDLIGTMDTEGAVMGVLVTLRDPTPLMERAAAAVGSYLSPGWGKRYPKVQIITVEGMLLAGDRIDMPPTRQTNVTLNPAQPAAKKSRKRPRPPEPPPSGLFD